MQNTLRSKLVLLKIKDPTPLLIVFTLPILLGLAVGFFSARGNWLYALALAAALPLIALICARPITAIILWMVFLPLSSALADNSNVNWMLHRILIPVTVVFALLPRVLRPARFPKLRLGLPEVALGVLSGLVLVGIVVFNGGSRTTLFHSLDEMIVPFGMYLIARLIALDGRDIKALEWTAFVVAVPQIIIGLVSWVAPHLLPAGWMHLVGIRTAGSLGDPAPYTSMLIFCTNLLFYAAMRTSNRFIRYLFLAVCGGSYVGVFISMERGSWLAGALVALGLLGLYPKTMLRLALLMVVVGATLGAGFFSKQIDYAIQRMNEPAGITSRIVVTDAMFRMIETKPVFGWGFEKLNQNIPNFYRIIGDAWVGLTFTTSHNTYLTIATEEGLVGCFLYLLPIAWLLASTIKTWRSPPRMEPARRLLLLGLWLAALHNFITSNFIDMRYFPIGISLLWFTLGLIANLLDQQAADREAAHHLRVLRPGFILRGRDMARPADTLLLPETNGTE